MESFRTPGHLYCDFLHEEAGSIQMPVCWEKFARWDTPIHVDAASGGFIAPFLYLELEWDSGFLHNLAVLHIFLSCQLLCHLAWECVKLLEDLLDICNQAFSRIP
ncbi:hypothetical protein DCAR_0205529 [Daucus carota subsp. sativus]|uniref:Uncharacterized protein n=1 Tax=Daucus carota subsp. sativus TaxID=79200 RepID=A0A166CP37_DAUCS|nr:hypothetical protein DCAR_0205529 [Daucus carota subsp. sativus]